MSEITIRQIDHEESIRISPLIRGYAFRPTMPLGTLEEEYRQSFTNFKNLTDIVLFEDGKPLVMVGSLPMTQNVRGKIVKMAGILGVASHPLARRRGFVRQAMGALLATERAKGMPVSGLYPFRESFYFRMGYVQFPVDWEYHFEPRELLPALKQRPEGELELLPIKEAFPQFKQVMRQTQQHIHGMSLFDDERAQSLANKESTWALFAKYEGEIIGVMLYSSEGIFKKTTISHFFYHDLRARYLFLDFLANHADQSSDFQMQLGPYEHPERWLVDLHVKAVRPNLIGMGRVLDIEQLEGLPCGDGLFTATIEDKLCPWNSGHWRFEGKNGELQVSKVESAACELSINAISALIFGTHEPVEYAYQGWGSPTPDMIEAMRQMFPLALPYMHEGY